MRAGISALALAGVLTVPDGAAPLAAAPVEVHHEAVPCVAVDRYARVTARSTGPVAAAELQFRADAASGWYAVRMDERDGEWGALLPRPTSALRQLEYRIVMTGPDAASQATSAARVPVRTAAECDAVASHSAEAAIVITVPVGAPAVPPVPAGFSPAGVVARGERAPLSRKMKVAGTAAGAAVLAATAAGLAGSSSDGRRSAGVFPDVRFNGTSPAPGSVLVPNRDRLVVQLEVGRSDASALAIMWVVELANSTTGRTCLFMNGRATLQQFPTPLELTGPLIATGGGGCGTRFDTDTVRVALTHFDNVFYEQTHALPFRFAP